MKVLLDTSFLVSSIGNRIDIPLELSKFGRPEMYTIQLVTDELKKLSSGRGKDSANAKISMDFIRRERVGIISAEEGNTDKRLIEIGEREGMAVCTVDKELRKRLKKAGVPVITIRQERYLVRER